MITDPVLVLVDLQKGFCDPDRNPALADDGTVKRIQDTISRTNDLLEIYRESGRTPVFVRTHHDPDGRRGAGDERPDNAPPPCLPGSEAAEFVEGLDVQDGVVVTKQGYDPFYDTELDSRLEDADVSQTLVGGAFTHLCVSSAVFGLTSRQHEVTVLVDCTAASSHEKHESAMDTLSAISDHVRSSSEVEFGPESG